MYGSTWSVYSAAVTCLGFFSFSPAPVRHILPSLIVIVRLNVNVNETLHICGNGTA